MPPFSFNSLSGVAFILYKTSMKSVEFQKTIEKYLVCKLLVVYRNGHKMEAAFIVHKLGFFDDRVGRYRILLKNRFNFMPSDAGIYFPNKLFRL